MSREKTTTRVRIAVRVSRKLMQQLKLLARNRLVVQWQYLVPWVVRRMDDIPALRRIGYDEARGAGYYGLLMAAEYFDASRGIKFCTYASRCIWEHVTKAMGSGTSVYVPEWLYAKQHADNHLQKYARAAERVINGHNLALLPKCECDEIADADERERIQEALSHLPTNLRIAIVSHIMEGETLKAVGERIGHTKESVRLLCRAAIKRLRKMLSTYM